MNTIDDISAILDEWEDQFTTKEERVRQEVALETVERLKRTSPEKTGEYAKGWEAKNTAGIITVYNAEKPSLTHLLEFGHAKVNGGRGRGRPQDRGWTHRRRWRL